MIVRDKKIKKDVWVAQKDCLSFECYHSHNCHVQGASGVRESKERYVCLTNFYNGCPETKRIKNETRKK